MSCTVGNCKPSGCKGEAGLWLLGLTFLLFGLAGSYITVFRPLYKVTQARNWVAKECVIMSSRVQDHENDDGFSYSIDIKFRYSYQNTKYISEDYSFFSLGTPGFSGKKKVITQHPVGSVHTCYVNPEKPWEAVIYRGLTWAILWGLIPLIFLLFALFILIVLAFYSKKS